MLNIFNGKTTSPNYRLVAPPDGKIQTLTIGEEVTSVHWRRLRILTLVVDDDSAPICCCSYPQERLIHKSTV